MKNERNFINNSNNLVNDPNYISFIEAQKQGLFNELLPKTYVVFMNGKFAGYSLDKDELIQKLQNEGKRGAILYKMVNTPERIFHFHSPHRRKEDQ